MSDQPKRRGRPPKDPSDLKTQGVTVRFTDAMMARIREEATANGTSLNGEVERRLAASLGFTSHAASVLEPDALTSRIRQIVRDEIEAAQARPHTVSFRVSQSKPVSDGSVRRVYESGAPVPVQIFGRDHLPS